MRVVIDSSVVVAALTTPNPESASRVVLAAVAAGAVELVMTDELEAEYRRAVEYPKVRRYAAKVDRQGFVDAIVATAERVEAGSAAGAVPADPGDDMVVAAALAGRAAVVVTLDRHLLVLEGLPGLQIQRPGDFLRELRMETISPEHGTPIVGIAGRRRDAEPKGDGIPPNGGFRVIALDADWFPRLATIVSSGSEGTAPGHGGCGGAGRCAGGAARRIRERRRPQNRRFP